MIQQEEDMRRQTQRGEIINRKTNSFMRKNATKVGPYNLYIARIVPQDCAIVEYIFARNMNMK